MRISDWSSDVCSSDLIRFTNDTEHDEPHEMVLFRRNDGVDDPIEDLLALPEDEVMSKVSMAGVVFADAPGSEAAAMLDLAPGSYVAICFIPTGGAEAGPTHFVGGMVAEFAADSPASGRSPERSKAATTTKRPGTRA